MQLLRKMRKKRHTSREHCSTTQSQHDARSNAVVVPEGGKTNGVGATISGIASERVPNKEDDNEMTTVVATPRNNNHAGNNGNDSVSANSSAARIKSRPLRLKLSDDMANAPPPCVVSLDETDGTTPPSPGRQPTKVSLTFYAYNPNARFGRSNPGLPDFGVAVMPYHSSGGGGGGPTFDILNSLVSLCEGGGGGECSSKSKEDGNGCRNDDDDEDDAATSGIPLRVVTVADGGAVIAFGLTNGEVPSINQRNN